jgi:adenylate cyclase
VDAVQCGVEIQQVLKAKNAVLPETRKMDFRIGINLGDVIEEGDSIYGDGVNIAARLEALAEPGGICISESAYQQIENKIPLRYDFLGEHAVKNIAKPVRVYRARIEPEAAPSPMIEEKKPVRKRLSRIVMAGIALVVIAGAAAVYQFTFRPSAPKMEVASKDKMALPLPDKPSIAVLPFANMGGEKKQEYLCDGLAEGIIDGLSKSEHLFVIARSSTFSYKGKAVKVKQVAEEMGVRYVMEGSIQPEGKRVRITVQLIDALSGQHLFSERYDRDLKDFLTLQDEITMRVLKAVRVILITGEGAILSGKGTKNLEAYLKTMQAKEILHGSRNKERIEKARRLLEEALALDPQYAAAYTDLASVHTNLVAIGASDSPRESLLKALDLNKKALALDDSDSHIHAGLAITYMFIREPDKSLAEAQKAVSLNPNSAQAYHALGWSLNFVGRSQEALPHLQKSLRLNPIPTKSNVFEALATSYMKLGRYEEAIAPLKRGLQIFGPDTLLTHFYLGRVYVLMGREKEAFAEWAEVRRIDPNFKFGQYVFGLWTGQSEKDRLLENMRKAGFITLSQKETEGSKKTITLPSGETEAQGPKKTITLPSGEVVCDLNGEWDYVWIGLGEMQQYGSIRDAVKITQQGNSFKGIRMIGNYMMPKGTMMIEGELDKNGFKKLIFHRRGVGGEQESIPIEGKISKDGNKIGINQDNFEIKIIRR